MKRSFVDRCLIVCKAVDYCFFVSLYRHNNFVLVSSLVTENPLVNRGLVANVSETNAKNLETIASLLADLLLCLSTPEDTRLLPYVILPCCLQLKFSCVKSIELIQCMAGWVGGRVITSNTYF